MKIATSGDEQSVVNKNLQLERTVEAAAYQKDGVANQLQDDSSTISGRIYTASGNVLGLNASGRVVSSPSASVAAASSSLAQLVISNMQANASGWSAQITVPEGGDYHIVIDTADANGNFVTFGSLDVEPGTTYQFDGCRIVP